MNVASADIARIEHGSSALNVGAHQDRDFRGSRNGSFRGQSRNVLAKPEAFSITQQSWSDRAAQAMRDHVGDDRHAAKRLCNILECSPRTAENFLLGRTTPSGIHFLRAYAMIPEFTAEVRRLTGKEASQDPTFERDLAAFLSRASQHLDRTTSAQEENQV